MTEAEIEAAVAEDADEAGMVIDWGASVGRSAAAEGHSQYAR